jgi:hypothetical protein
MTISAQFSSISISYYSFLSNARLCRPKEVNCYLLLLHRPGQTCWVACLLVGLPGQVESGLLDNTHDHNVMCVVTVASSRLHNALQRANGETMSHQNCSAGFETSHLSLAESSGPSLG